jgi:hypothetical protein
MRVQKVSWDALRRSRTVSGMDAMHGEVEANITYALKGASKPFCYEYDPPPGRPRRSSTYQPYRCIIRNGRERQPALSLSADGFALRRHATRVRNFYDKGELRDRYDAEVEELIRDATDAQRVVVFDHTVRGRSEAQHAGTKVHTPVLRAHNDYTVDSAPVRARQVLGGEEDAERLLANGFLEVNVWRPIRGPLRSMPLAVCSAASMQPADFLACDLIFRDRLGEIYEIAHNPGHEWYWFPDMQPDEVLLLKCFDSRDEGRFGAHSAFEHPRTPADAPPRESIETRAFAFFSA